MGLAFVPSIQNECLLIEKVKGDIEGMMCLWVDDMVLLGTPQNFYKNFKNKVSEKLKISSYGKLSWFLNNKIEKTEKPLKLSWFLNNKIEKTEIPLEVISKLDSAKKEAKNINICSLVIIKE